MIVPTFNVEQIRTEITVSLSGPIDAIPAGHNGKPYRPDAMTVEIRDADLYAVTMTGPRVLAKGRTSEQRSTERYTPRRGGGWSALWEYPLPAWALEIAQEVAR